MKKFKIIIIMIMFMSAYTEKDMIKWLSGSPVSNVVYAHMRFKEKKHWLHKALVNGTRINREKQFDCFM